MGFCVFLDFSGELRTNENTALSVMQTIFLREHNRLVRVLYKANPRWDREVLFQVKIQEGNTAFQQNNEC